MNAFLARIDKRNCADYGLTDFASESCSLPVIQVCPHTKSKYFKYLAISFLFFYHFLSFFLLFFMVPLFLLLFKCNVLFSLETFMLTVFAIFHISFFSNRCTILFFFFLPLFHFFFLSIFHFFFLSFLSFLV